MKNWPRLYDSTGQTLLAILDDAYEVIVQDQVLDVSGGHQILDFAMPLESAKALLIDNELTILILEPGYVGQAQPQTRFVIRTKTESRDPNGLKIVQVHAEATWYDLGAADPIAYPLGAANPTTAINDITAGTGWSAGTVGVANSLVNYYYSVPVTPLTALRNMTSVFGGELSFDTIAKKVNLVPKRGNASSGLFFAYGKNLGGNARISDTTRLITRLRPIGSGGVDVSLANGGVTYIDDYTFYDSRSWARQIKAEVLVNDQIFDPTALLAWGRAQLATFNKPKLTYTLLPVILDTESMPALGDTVRVWDRELRLDVNARVAARSLNVMLPELSTITLDTALYSLADTLNGTLQSIPISPLGAPDSLPPAQVTGVTAGSVDRVDLNGNHSQRLLLSWAVVTTNADGTPIRDLDHYVVSYTLATSPSVVIPVGTVTGNQVLSEIVPEGAVFTASVYAVDHSGNPGAAGTFTGTVASPTNPPPVPSAPILDGASLPNTVRARWDGLSAAGAAMSSDTNFVEVHAGTTSNFTPSAATLVDVLFGPGVIPIFGSGTVYVLFRAVGKTKLTSVSSVVSSAPTRLTNTADLSPGAVTAAILAQYSVTANAIAANSITASAISAQSIIASAIGAGAITASAIAQGAVTAQAIAANSIYATAIAANQIYASAIAAGQILASAIGAGQILASAIGANQITAAAIAAGAITTDKLTVGGGLGNNYIFNAGFEDGLANWSPAYESVGAPPAFHVDTTAATVVAGAQCITIDNLTANAGGNALASRAFPVRSGDVLFLSVLLRQTGATPKYVRVVYGTADGFPTASKIAGTPAVPANVGFYNLAGAFVSAPAVTSAAGYQELLGGAALPGSATWYELQGQITVPTGATWARLTLYSWQSASTSSDSFDQCKVQPVSISASIADGSITTNKMVAGSVTAAQIAAGAISADKISSGTISTPFIVLNTRLTTQSGGGQSGNRVELDPQGLRAYDSGGNLLVNVSSVGSATFVGTVNASTINTTDFYSGNTYPRVHIGPQAMDSMGYTCIKLEQTYGNGQIASQGGMYGSIYFLPGGTFSNSLILTAAGDTPNGYPGIVLAPYDPANTSSGFGIARVEGILQVDGMMSINRNSTNGAPYLNYEHPPLNDGHGFLRCGNYSALKFLSGQANIQVRSSSQDVGYGTMQAIINNVSSIKFKDNVQPYVGSCLAQVLSAPVRTWSYKTDVPPVVGVPVKMEIGPVLEEMPVAAQSGSDAYSTATVTGLLWGSVQELSAKIDAINAKLPKVP